MAFLKSLSTCASTCNSVMPTGSVTEYQKCDFSLGINHKRWNIFTNIKPSNWLIFSPWLQLKGTQLKPNCKKLLRWSGLITRHNLHALCKAPGSLKKLFCCGWAFGLSAGVQMGVIMHMLLLWMLTSAVTVIDCIDRVGVDYIVQVNAPSSTLTDTNNHDVQLFILKYNQSVLGWQSWIITPHILVIVQEKLQQCNPPQMFYGGYFKKLKCMNILLLYWTASCALRCF